MMPGKLQFNLQFSGHHLFFRKDFQMLFAVEIKSSASCTKSHIAKSIQTNLVSQRQKINTQKNHHVASPEVATIIFEMSSSI